jgi:hypothetical protein
LSEPQPAEWRPIPRQSPLYDELPKGWLVFDDDAVEKAGRLRYGVAWTGLEYDARQREEAVLSAINALSDEELARENERRLKLIEEAARQQRAQLASAAAQGETIRMTPPEGAEEAIARARGGAPQAGRGGRLDHGI